MGTQGNLSGNPSIQPSDLAAAQLHSRGGQDAGKARGEERAGLISLVGKEGREGAAEDNEEGLGGEFLPISQKGVIRGSGGSDGFPGGAKSRPEARITEDGVVQLPVETAAGGGGARGQGSNTGGLKAEKKSMVVGEGRDVEDDTRAGFKERGR
jgi:hypothetical protein